MLNGGKKDAAGGGGVGMIIGGIKRKSKQR